MHKTSLQVRTILTKITTSSVNRKLAKSSSKNTHNHSIFITKEYHLMPFPLPSGKKFSELKENR